MREHERVAPPATPKLIAPLWHTFILLAVLAALTVLGWLAQRNATSHAAAPVRLLPLQVQAIVFEWAMAAWVWFGVHRKGIRVRDLIGGRWPNAQSVLTDIFLAGSLWVLWTGVSRLENFLLGRNPAAGAIPYPAGWLEGIFAVAVALSAGICEEIVFRGYFQRQFQILCRSVGAAVVLQAVVFGLPHVYQGTRVAGMVVLYGLLFGALALWRQSLRPGMLAHAWSDIAARLLRI